MKILQVSDLHFEGFLDRGKEFTERLKSDGVDVLCLPGDIIASRDFNVLQTVFGRFCDKFKHVVAVFGNHEFYSSDVYTKDRHLVRLNAEFPNLHILDNSFVEIDGQRFIGGTSWFKKDLNTTEYDKSCMGDFSYINNFEPWVYKKNKAFRELMEKELKSSDVVISHHMPSYLAVAPMFKNSRLNQFFVNDSEKLIKERQPKLWMAGHTHFAMQINIGLTKLSINPLGYHSEKYSSGFNPNLIMEI